MRDLNKDLEICKKTTPGTWRYDLDGSLAMIFSGQDNITDFSVSEEDAKFIVAAHEGWPEAINRALQSEKTAESRQRTLDDIYAKTERLHDWARENLTGVLAEQFWNICANGSLIEEEPRYHQRFNYMKHRAESAEAEVKKLRKALALAHSMILGGEQHTEQSRQVIEGALGLR